ncbi:MAG TPA: hypothetical protein VKH44_10785 [Pirellulaceae bacterium]|nr:hypothetical protein [Pirellulaceae bacterium]
MRTFCWGISLFGVALLCISVQAIEPGAEKDLPFWQLPKTNVDLRSLSPAEVKLVAGPDMGRGLILLQTGEVAPPADFVPGNEELKPFLPEKDSGYMVIPKGLKVGAVTFGDRKYKIEKLPPAFAGLTLLQTKAGHKAVIDANYAIVVSAAKPCLVFVALDQRVMDTYTQHGTPGWLQEFAPTDEKIKTDDPIMAQTGAEFLVFVRKSAGGRIVLGPPAMDISFNSMYFAFFGEPKREEQAK